jgi:hypothetical protein
MPCSAPAPSRLWGLVALVLATTSCKTTPATVLLHIRADATLTSLDELRLSVLGPGGFLVKEQRVPAQGAPLLPGDLVLYPREVAALRIDVRALLAASPAGEGAVLVQPRPGAQVEATVTLQGGLLPDGDGDGIPDVIDNCPVQANPDQGPCPALDGGVDARAEAGMDARADARADARRDARADLGVDLRITCTSDAECDDKSSCTADSCSVGQCKHQATNESQACDDGNACTSGTTCKSGLCTGGSGVTCPSPPDPCSPYVCDTVEGCVIQPLANGASCDDGHYCTTPDSCTSGKCGGLVRNCAATAPACKQAAGCDDSQAQCIYVAGPSGGSCDDGSVCTQGEICQNGTCTPPDPSTEVIEPVYFVDGTDRSMRLDAQGKVHVAYYANQAVPKVLKHATNASGSWAIETVDSSSTDVGAYPSMAISSQGTIYIAYVNATGGQAKIAMRAGASWQSAALDASSGYTALALDGGGQLHVAYQQGNNLMHATGSYPPTGWTKTQVDTPAGYPMVGLRTSIVVDGNGKVHIAHGTGTKTTTESVQDLRYTTNASGTWVSTSPISGVGTRGGVPSIALGPAGQVFISHSSTSLPTATAGTLYLSSRVGTNWSTQTVPDPGVFSSLALTSGLKAHLVYRNPTTRELRYATNDSGTWSFTTLDSTGSGTLGYVSMAQQASGQVHITYKVTSPSAQIRHAVLSGCP